MNRRDDVAATVDERLLRAIDTADKACTSMTAFGSVNDKWMRGFLAALADEGLAVVEVETTCGSDVSEQESEVMTSVSGEGVAGSLPQETGSRPGTHPRRASPAASDHDGFTPVFLFAHDYGTHLPYCEILQVETSIKCTCGFKEALEAALASERGESRV